MKVKKKNTCESIPKHGSHSGLSRDNWQKLNEGKSVNIDEIPEAAKSFLEEVKKGK